MPRIVATIEARMASTRLPGKVLLEAGGRPMLELMVERLRGARRLDAIVVATTDNPGDQPIEDLARRLGIGVWRGSEDDVMRRVLDAATAHDADVIVELTGDCPLIDPSIVDRVVEAFLEAGTDYAANDLERTWPIGMDTEVFTTHALADAEARTQDPEDREHVSPYLYRNPQRYTRINVAAPASQRRPELRLTLDTAEDLALIRAVFDALGTRPPAFGLDAILAFLDRHPEIAALNAAVPHRYVV